MGTLRIGELAERAGVTPQAIRYYERLGLLKPPPRSASGYRRYDERVLEEIAFIKRAQALGFTLGELQEIVQLARAGRAPCARVLAMAERRVAELDARLADLAALRDRLARAVAAWRRHADPADGAAALCSLIARTPLETRGAPPAAPAAPRPSGVGPRQVITAEAAPPARVSPRGRRRA